MELIGIGDLHFDKLDKLIPEVNTLIKKSITKCLNYALENGVDNVVFYGDIGEKSRLSYSAQITLNEILFDKKYSGLKFHFILGNHDFDELGVHSLQVLQDIPKSVLPNVTVYSKPKIITIEDKKVKFLPHPYTNTESDCINIGHFETTGSLRDNGRKIEEGFDTEHVCLLGHLHTNHRVKNCFYSGTLYQTNFGESMPKFFHHVTVNKKKLDVKNIPFEPYWQLINLEVYKKSDLVIKTDENCFYKLFIHEGVDLDRNALFVKYPNILRINNFKTTQELKESLSDSWEFDNDGITTDVVFDDTEIVKSFLKQNGLSKTQRQRAFSILDETKKILT
jgi:DNA repair exonuclease SbcCD nuclease subunit